MINAGYNDPVYYVRGEQYDNRVRALRKGPIMGRHGGDVNKFCVKLSCGCFATFRYGIPKEGDTVYCRKHDDYMAVVIPKVNWRLMCYDCAYTVNTGGTQITINGYASKHVTHKGHRVHVWQDGGQSYIVALRDTSEA